MRHKKLTHEQTDSSDVLSVPVVLLHPTVLDDLAQRVAAASQRSPWLDASEVAERLRCGKRRVYDLVQQGRIPHRREGARLLFRVDEVDAWVDSGAAEDADTALTPTANLPQIGGFSTSQRSSKTQVRRSDHAA